jgi:hypothetical protein
MFSVRTIWPFLIGFAVVCAGNGETAGVLLHSRLPVSGWFKVSGGYVVQFERLQKAAGHDSLEVFDRNGQRVWGLDVLAALGDSVNVALSDIAVRRGGPVVAGATVKRRDGRVQALLLYFAMNGGLARSLLLPPEQGINNIDIDAAGNVWTLTDYFGRDDDTRGPLIFEYDGAGRLSGTLLRRTDLSGGFCGTRNNRGRDRIRDFERGDLVLATGAASNVRGGLTGGDSEANIHRASEVSGERASRRSGYNLAAAVRQACSGDRLPGRRHGRRISFRGETVRQKRLGRASAYRRRWRSACICPPPEHG